MSNKKGFADGEDEKKRKRQNHEGREKKQSKKQKVWNGKKIKIKMSGICIAVWLIMILAPNMALITRVVNARITRSKS
eukprot:9064515-Ditylum_brightwellii.AAC.1